MSELTKTLCNMIKGLREKEGASLEAFSEKLGISKTSLQNIERGGANPTLETVEQVADALGVSPLVLLAGDYDTEEFRIAWLLLLICQIHRFCLLYESNFSITKLSSFA